MKRFLLILILASIVAYAVWAKYKAYKEGKPETNVKSAPSIPLTFTLEQLARLANEYDYNVIGGECVNRGFNKVAKVVDSQKVYEFYRERQPSVNDLEYKIIRPETLIPSEQNNNIIYAVEMKNHYDSLISYLDNNATQSTKLDTLLKGIKFRKAYMIDSCIILDQNFIIEQNGYCFWIMSVNELRLKRANEKELLAKAERVKRDSIRRSRPKTPEVIPSKGVIAVHMAVVYENIGSDFYQIGKVIPDGTVVQIADAKGNYYFCEFAFKKSGIITGWVKKADVRLF